VKPVPADRQKGKSKKKQVIKASSEGKKPAGPEHQQASIYRLLLEKVPLLALAALSSVITYIAQQRGDALLSINKLPMYDRIANAFVSYFIYIEKMIWPSNLAVLYPYPRLLPLWQVLGAIVILMTMTLTVFWLAKRFPYLAVGWFWYVGTLVPVIGIVQVGSQARADRYTYLPLVGLSIMLAWGMPALLQKWRYRKAVFITLSVLSFFCLSIVTWVQVGYWQNSITLYNHTLNVTDHNSIIYYNRGASYKNLGNQKQEINDYDKAIEINPNYAEVYNNRGVSYANLGNYKQALIDFNRAIEINPHFAEAYNNRGASYKNLGDQKREINDYDKAIEINPNFADAFYNRGVAYAALGNYRWAIIDYNRAIVINANYAKAYNNRGVSYANLGNYKQAIIDFGRAIEINPHFAEAYNNRAAAYHFLGNYKQAIIDYNRAIEIDPNYANAYYNRGTTHGELGNRSLAMDDLKVAAKFGHGNAQNILRRQGIKW
jgi:tetratricopeptide (TPR) repeat protein